MQWLAQAGLSNALAATLLALLASAVGSVGRRPALTHSLWLLVLLKLVTPPIAPVALHWARGAAARLASPNEPGIGSGTERQPPVLDRECIVAEDLTPSAASAEVEAGESPGIAKDETAFIAEARATLLAGLGPWPLIGWAVGALGWWGLAVRRIVRFQRSLHDAEPPPDDLSDQVRRLATRLGLQRCPRIGLVPGLVPPLVWSIGGATRLVLPSALWERLGAEERESLLIHELAHLRRRDHWTRWLELLVGGLYWWHPVVWWARRALREVEEQCCDAWVVWAWPESARTYARALLTTLDFLSEPRPAAPLAASGIGHVSCLKRRLTMIVRARTPKDLSWPGRLAVLTLAIVLLPLAPTWAQRDSERNPDALPPGSPAPPRTEDPAPRPREEAPEAGRTPREAARPEALPGDSRRSFDEVREAARGARRALPQRSCNSCRNSCLADLEGRPRRRVVAHAAADCSPRAFRPLHPAEMSVATTRPRPENGANVPPSRVTEPPSSSRAPDALLRPGWNKTSGCGTWRGGSTSSSRSCRTSRTTSEVASGQKRREVQ